MHACCIVTGLLLMAGPALGPTPTVTEEPLSPSTAHQEIPDDPPSSPIERREAPPAAPRRVWTRGPYRSVQVNVDEFGQNIPGDAANEPSIAVDPTDASRIVIGWRQFDTVLSNFRQAGWGFSHDGGSTWTFPGTLEPGVFRSDPVLGFSAEGVIYYYSLADDFTCQLFRSFDAGVSWGGPIPAFGGDKAWMTVDRTGGIGHCNIYGAWSPVAGCCGGRIFTRSTDGGLTFLEPISLPGSPRWGTLTVAPDGTLFVAGLNPGFLVVRSRNARNPAVVPLFDPAVSVDLGGEFASGGEPNPGGLVGQVWVASDHSTGLTRGNIYLLSSVDPPGPDPLDVMFARSIDGGSNWSTPVRINDDPPGDNAWQWFATLSVAPNGRIDVVWNDTRLLAIPNVSELYYSYSIDGGLSWADNVPVSPAFDSHIGWPNQFKIGDYYDMISDVLGADVAYAATFNGEQDVYYLRIGSFDCNNNGVDDLDDIAAGTSLDCNTNSIPDECERDCNANDVPDDCDIRDGFSLDCNDDLVPDECQLAGNDCDEDGVPDDCQIAEIITTQPSDTYVCPSETAVFSVEAAGQSLSFQWRLDGLPLADGGGVSGSATDTLTIEGVDAADAGSYACEVADGCLVAESNPALLTVVVAASVLQQPSPLVISCVGQALLLTVVAGGTPPFEYQWSKDGLPLTSGGRISGAQSARLLITELVASDAGAYVCHVSNMCGDEDSDPASLQFASPVFTLHPKDTCAEQGETAVFAAAAGVPPPQLLGWRWKKDGQVLSDGGGVSGSHSDTLTIMGVAMDDAGQYSALAFSFDPVCLTESDSASLTVGGCAVCEHPGDLDGDGDHDLVDFQEFALCFGADVSEVASCICANVDDSDSVVNLADWTALEALITGPVEPRRGWRR